MGRQHHSWRRVAYTSHLSLSFLQIDWPAPQDKKRECVAKGKNNQVTWILADSVRVIRVTCLAQGQFLKMEPHESNITHFTLLNYILSSQAGVSNWKPSSHYISTQ